MSVTNGQPGDQTTFNNAFVSKTTASTISANVQLADAAVGNGSTIDQIQREHNSISSYTGHIINTAKDVKPAWTSNNYGVPTNNLLERSDAHDVAIAAVSALTNINIKETFVLDGTDITNQYIDLANVAKFDSIIPIVQGLPPILEGASYDYDVDYTGGVAGVTRINFLNDLATGGNSALVATDVIQIKYQF